MEENLNEGLADMIGDLAPYEEEPINLYYEPPRYSISNEPLPGQDDYVDDRLTPEEIRVKFNVQEELLDVTMMASVELYEKSLTTEHILDITQLALVELYEIIVTH